MAFAATWQGIQQRLRELHHRAVHLQTEMAGKRPGCGVVPGGAVEWNTVLRLDSRGPAGDYLRTKALPAEVGKRLSPGFRGPVRAAGAEADRGGSLSPEHHGARLAIFREVKNVAVILGKAMPIRRREIGNAVGLLDPAGETKRRACEFGGHRPMCFKNMAEPAPLPGRTVEYNWDRFLPRDGIQFRGDVRREVAMEAPEIAAHGASHEEAGTSGISRFVDPGNAAIGIQPEERLDIKLH